MLDKREELEVSKARLEYQLELAFGYAKNAKGDYPLAIRNRAEYRRINRAIRRIDKELTALDGIQ